MPYREIIAAAYDSGVDEEYRRLEDSLSGVTEYQIFIDLFHKFIPDGKTVIDIGTDSGRYAEYLLRRNCKVGVVDLSARSLKAFSDRLSEANFIENIIFNKVSCATQLDWIEGGSADVILLMGPLYHLINEEHRILALNNCKRILKGRGLLFTVFLSQGVNFGSITYTRFQGFDVPQFRCHPAEAKKFMESNGFKTLCMNNIGLSDQFFYVGSSDI